MIAAGLALLAFFCVLAAARLAQARWPWRDPRPGILLWQALGLAWGMAATGALLAYGLEPYQQGILFSLIEFAADPPHVVAAEPPAMTLDQHIALVAGLALLGALITVLIAACVSVVRARRRHRLLLSLVGEDAPDVPGVLVLDHPGAAAYCVPGLRSRVVISAGALRLLDPGELTAVLAHEHAHARERHDLVLLPFSALRRALPWSRTVRGADDAVGLLVEMCADDCARRRCASHQLATALLRFSAAGPVAAPSGALGVTGTPESEVAARVNRLLDPAPALPRRLRVAILATAAALATAPPFLWLLPH